MDLNAINNFKNLPEIAEILKHCENNDLNNQQFNSIFEPIINSERCESDSGESKNTTDLIQKIKTFFNNTNSGEAIKDIEYWTDLIYKNSKEFNFPPEVLIAIIRQECDFKRSIKNPMQITRITVEDIFLHKNKYCKLNEKLYNEIMSLCNGNKNKLINLYKTNPDISIKIGMLCYLSKGNSSKDITEWNLKEHTSAAYRYNGSPLKEKYANSVEGFLKILDFPNTSIDVYYAQNTENPQNTETKQFGV